MTNEFVLRLNCADRPGIVAGLSSCLFEHGFNIVDSQQFDDVHSGRFFVRMAFHHTEATATLDEARVKALLAPVSERFGMDLHLRSAAHRKRVLLMASRSDHCLADLLYRWHIGELPIDIVGIISNHPRDSFPHLDFGTTPFHHLPVLPGRKAEQEAQVWSVVQDSGAELVVLARYMQILSDELATQLSGWCINIHHSFLPGFKGAQPYHQAFARGVKMIGATAHYVTADLDEGPIIAQDVESISHRDGPDELVRKGRDIERRVLARAVRLHIEDRVLPNGSKTVVFA
jgi:formyltetrahydrofolate deformylase